MMIGQKTKNVEIELLQFTMLNIQLLLNQVTDSLPITVPTLPVTLTVTDRLVYHLILSKENGSIFTMDILMENNKLLLIFKMHLEHTIQSKLMELNIIAASRNLLSHSEPNKDTL